MKAVRNWLRRRAWRVLHRRYGLRLTFTGGRRSCPDWDKAQPMWSEFDRAVVCMKGGRQGDLILIEAIDDGMVVGRHWATPEGGAE